ncbi:gamma-glutamyl-gamma-aminobutyrate hydrolase family protein [Cetobacterium sp. 2A]|uniref:gamma-glutamyl-gamma-aminobutyrate hydrolase family protein n=1 Tax=Cetobacterium sp. 2A TaxID=2754723 RepID=UPI00163C3C18|nr:gamma-glutamyl-gamma-aminobutyrate hydrolase family protein [Cetobacterium sp. 2A]
MKPLIGITSMAETGERLITKNFINFNYVNSVIKAGGIPVILPILDTNINDSFINDYVMKLDGIIFSGGEDISPLLYNENPNLKLGKIDTKRDVFELKLLAAALEKNIPILGICRGCQILNVGLGGSLYQDIDSQVENVFNHHPTGILGEEIYHTVNIKQDSFLKTIFTENTIGVNSFHHQSVKTLAPSLKISATSDDGIIEAYESNDMNSKFIVGIQWHPEAMVNKFDIFLNIFKLFVEKSNKKN